MSHLALTDWQIRAVLPHRAPILQLQFVENCGPDLASLQAGRMVAADHPMLVRAGDVTFLAQAALVETLAQSCGLLLRLRWLRSQGVDLARFAAGDAGALAGYEIPRSVLADVQAKFTATRVLPHTTLRASVTLLRAHGEMYRFECVGTCDGVEILHAALALGFPRISGL